MGAADDADFEVIGLWGRPRYCCRSPTEETWVTPITRRTQSLDSTSKGNRPKPCVRLLLLLPDVQAIRDR